MKAITLLLLLLTQICFTQSDVVSETLRQIEIKDDTIRSVYEWVTDNIKYDVNKLNDIKKGSKSRKPSGFKTEEEYKSHLLNKVGNQKKGVCEDYALLFNSLVKKLGYDAYIIEGYTKSEKGRVNRSIGHAWNAVKVNGEWKLYDTTWGAGYVKDGKKFVKNYDTQWYETDPEKMIKTHMPYDPVWQLLYTPLSYKNFENGTAVQNAEANYDFEVTIEEYLAQDKKQKMLDQVSRSENLGDGISLIDKWRKRMTKNVSMFGIEDKINTVEEAQVDATEAVDLYNKFIDAKNKQFKGNKYALDIVKQNLDDAKVLIQSSLNTYKSTDIKGRQATSQLRSAVKQCEKLLAAIDKQILFVEGME